MYCLATAASYASLDRLSLDLLSTSFLRLEASSSVDEVVLDSLARDGRVDESTTANKTGVDKTALRELMPADEFNVLDDPGALWGK